MVIMTSFASDVICPILEISLGFHDAGVNVIILLKYNQYIIFNMWTDRRITEYETTQSDPMTTQEY
jgi:hypothetical protein